MGTAPHKGFGVGGRMGCILGVPPGCPRPALSHSSRPARAVGWGRVTMWLLRARLSWQDVWESPNVGLRLLHRHGFVRSDGGEGGGAADWCLRGLA